MSARTRLFRVRDPYDAAASEKRFWEAVQESHTFHYTHCSEYRTISDALRASPEDLRNGGYDAIPFLPTLLFKNHHLFSMPAWRLPIKATSSGTKGRFSRIGFDAGGLLCGLRMVLKIGKRRKLFSPIPVHYVLLGYKPHRGNATAVTKTAFGATLFAPALSRTYALTYGPDGYKPDLERIIDTLLRRSRSRFPIRLMGFPSYTYFVLRTMEERGLSVQLKKGSKILLGGGWKQFYAEQVDKSVLYGLARRVLGIEECDIVEFFGAVEHPILYADCDRHHFHVPAYSRVIIRDVHTLEPVPNGTPGLVNLITPMVRGTPILSVMTDDLGILQNGESCGCGITSPYLEILGRVGLKDIKTCAAGAAELLTEVPL